MGCHRGTECTEVCGFLADAALHCMHYYFVPIHCTPRATPAMRAGLTDGVGGCEAMRRSPREGVQ